MGCSDPCDCQGVPRVILWSEGAALADVVLRERRGDPERGCIYSGAASDALRVEWDAASDLLRLVSVDAHGHEGVSLIYGSIAASGVAVLPVEATQGAAANELLITLQDWMLHVPTVVSAESLPVDDCTQPVVEDLGDGSYRVTRSPDCSTTVRVGDNWIAWSVVTPASTIATTLSNQGVLLRIPASHGSATFCDSNRRDIYEPGEELSDPPPVWLGASADAIRPQLDLQAVSTRAESRCCAECPPRIVQIIIESETWFPQATVQSGEWLALPPLAPPACEWPGDFQAYSVPPEDFDAEVDSESRIRASVTVVSDRWQLRLRVGVREFVYTPISDVVDDRRSLVIPLKLDRIDEPLNAAGQSTAGAPDWWEALDHSDDLITLHVLWESAERVMAWPFSVLGVEALPIDRLVRVVSSGWDGADECHEFGYLNDTFSLDTLQLNLAVPTSFPAALSVLAGHMVEVPECLQSLYQYGGEPSSTAWPRLHLAHVSGATAELHTDSEFGPLASTERVANESRVELRVWFPALVGIPKGVVHVFVPSDAPLLEWDFAAAHSIDWVYSYSITDVRYFVANKSDWQSFIFPAWPPDPVSGQLPSNLLLSDPRDVTLTTTPAEAISTNCTHCEPWAGEPPMLWLLSWAGQTLALPRTGSERWSCEVVVSGRTLLFRLDRPALRWRLTIIEIDPVVLDDDDEPLPRRWPVRALYEFLPEGIDGHTQDVWAATEDDPDPPRFKRWRVEHYAPNELVLTWRHPDEATLPAVAIVAGVGSTNPRGTSWQVWSSTAREWIEDEDQRECAEGFVPGVPYSRGARHDAGQLVPCEVPTVFDVDPGEAVWWSPTGEAWVLIVSACSDLYHALDEPPVAPNGPNDLYRALCLPVDGYAPTGCDWYWSEADGELLPFPANECVPGKRCDPPTLAEGASPADGDKFAGTCQPDNCVGAVVRWTWMETPDLPLDWYLNTIGMTSCVAWCAAPAPDHDGAFLGDFVDVPCACSDPECP